MCQHNVPHEVLCVNGWRHSRSVKTFWPAVTTVSFCVLIRTSPPESYDLTHSEKNVPILINHQETFPVLGNWCSTENSLHCVVPLFALHFLVDCFRLSDKYLSHTISSLLRVLIWVLVYGRTLILCVVYSIMIICSLIQYNRVVYYFLYFAVAPSHNYCTWEISGPATIHLSSACGFLVSPIAPPSPFMCSLTCLWHWSRAIAEYIFPFKNCLYSSGCVELWLTISLMWAGRHRL